MTKFSAKASNLSPIYFLLPPLWSSLGFYSHLLTWLSISTWFSLLFRVSLFFSFIFVSWKLITLQYCSGFCHTLTRISHGFTCVPHPNPPSRLPPHPTPLGHPSAPPWALAEFPLPGSLISQPMLSAPAFSHDSLRPVVPFDFLGFSILSFLTIVFFLTYLAQTYSSNCFGTAFSWIQ